MKIKYEQNPLRSYICEYTDEEKAKAKAKYHKEEEDESCFEDDLKLLKSGHFGDCVCFPCTCMQCLMESMFDVDTIEGLGNHEAHFIETAFSHPETKNISDAITYLENYSFVFTGENGWENQEERWNYWVPRWKEQLARSIEWLKKYKNDHFPSN